MFELCLTLKPYFSFVNAAQSTVDRLAWRTGGMAHLLLRSGTEFVCAVRGGDDAVIKAPSIEVGTRRPLLAAAGGISMLAAMDMAEACRIVKQNITDASRYGQQRLDRLRRLIPPSRRQGYCFIQGQFVLGIHAVGVPILDTAGKPIASLSAVAPAHILPATRSKLVAGWLRNEASDLRPLTDALSAAFLGVNTSLKAP